MGHSVSPFYTKAQHSQQMARQRGNGLQTVYARQLARQRIAGGGWELWDVPASLRLPHKFIDSERVNQAWMAR
jgi:hypothetical protein